MRVVFYNAPAFTESALRYRLNPPLAPAILAAIFEQAGHEAEATDLEALGVGPERLARAYRAQPDRWPDAIGFTVCSFAAQGARDCVSALREAGYGGYIALGGPHITLLGRGPVDELESWGADAWIVGECEGNVVRVFEERQRGLIQGERAPIESIPAPLWAKHRPGVGVVYAGNQPFTGHPEWISMWSRGCPHDCTFCGNVVFGRQAIRRRPAAAIREELAGLARRGIKSVYVYDDELIGFPGRHNDWLADVCREVAPLGLRYKAQGRCSERAVTPDVLGEMAAAGFRAVQWGVESFSERVLDALHKGTDEGDIWASLERAHAAGLANGLFMMVGNPGETEADLEHTEECLRRAQARGLVQWLQVTVLTPMPGTPLYAQAIAEGWYREPPNERMVGAYMNTPTMKAADIEGWRLRLLGVAT